MTRTSRPARRKTSARWRTAVVLPVPPFWERTAILWATRARVGQRRRAAPRCHTMATRSGPGSRHPGPSVPLLRGPCGPKSGLAGGLHGFLVRGDGHVDRVEEVQAVAPDDDLVTVAQHPPLDALAVHEHAVQAAVVEDPHAVGLAHDQRVAARDRGVVEAHVGRQAASDARPLAVERRDAYARPVVPGQVLAGLPDQHPGA